MPRRKHNPSAPAACLTADLSRSRDLPDRAAVQQMLRGAIEGVNGKRHKDILVPFSITSGDEWQGLARDAATAVGIDLQFRRLLLPYSFTAGIGLGRIATPLAERTGEMDGECFHRARAALQAAGKRGGPSTAIHSGDGLFDATVEGYMNLLHAISSQWTQSQLRVLDAYEKADTETAAAEALGVTQPTVHKSLARSFAKTYISSAAALLDFVRVQAAAGDA